MLERHLLRELDQVAGRLRRWRLGMLLGANWLVFAVIGFGLLELDPSRGMLRWLVPGLAAVAVLAAVLLWAIQRRTALDYRRVARKIEARYPDLNSVLLAAVEQQPQLRWGRLGFLQECVVREAITHSRRRPWSEIVSPSQLAIAQAGNVAALVLLVVVLSTLTVRAGSTRLADEAAAGAAAVLRVGSFEATIEPGDAEIERGTSLLVLARFRGNVPEQATLVVRGVASEEPQESDVPSPDTLDRSIAMSRSLDDPLLAGRIASVPADLNYHVEIEGQRSDTFRVKVFDYPKPATLDVGLVFPEFTSLPPAVIEDTLRVTAVQGTQATFTARLNKPVVAAELFPEDGGPIVMTANSGDSRGGFRNAHPDAVTPVSASLDRRCGTGQRRSAPGRRHGHSEQAARDQAEMAAPRRSGIAAGRTAVARYGPRRFRADGLRQSPTRSAARSRARSCSVARRTAAAR
jgi:hypothetical protein